MTINNIEAYVKALWDWGLFDECFERGARFSDIDGVVDCDGHILIIEAKPVGYKISTGQLRVLGALARLGADVLIVYGEPGNPQFCAFVCPDGTPDGELVKHPVTLEIMQEALRWWWQWANTNPAPNRIWGKYAPWDKEK